jgi:hypothetical protein
VSFESIATTESAHAAAYSLMLLKLVRYSVRLDGIMLGVFDTNAFAPVARRMIVILRTKMGFEVTFEVRDSLVDLSPATLGTNEVGQLDSVIANDSSNDLRDGLGGLFIARRWSHANTLCRAERRVGRVRRQRRPYGSLGASRQRDRATTFQILVDGLKVQVGGRNILVVGSSIIALAICILIRIFWCNW